MNAAAGLAIDLVSGFVMAWIFLLLAAGLPGTTGLAKGLSFGLVAWFFRVVMSAAGQWMVFKIPAAALLYTLATGLVEMLALGVLYGLILWPGGAAHPVK